MDKKIKKFGGSLTPIFPGSPVDDSFGGNGLDLDPLTRDFSIELSIEKVRPRENQPRKNFNDSSLEELASSIKSTGIIQPIIVQKVDQDIYEIITGERRWRAAKKAGLSKIPVIIREYHKLEILTVALIENIQREDLNPLEEAQAIQSLLEEGGLTHNEIAERLGKARTTVTNLLRLLTLSDPLKEMVNSGLLEKGHVKVLLSLNEQEQIEIAKIVVSKNLSVREAEKLVQQWRKPIKIREPLLIHPQLEKKIAVWKSDISEKLSSPVNVDFHSNGKGKIVIHFSSLEEIDGLLDKILIS